MADPFHLERMGRELKCPICLSLFNSAASLTCNHVFCGLCIEKSMKSASDCPVCKIPFRRREIRPAPHMDNLVSIYKSMEVASGLNIFVSQNAPSVKEPEAQEDQGNNHKICEMQETDKSVIDNKTVPEHLKRCKKRGRSSKACTTTSGAGQPSFPRKKRVHVQQYPLPETPKQCANLANEADDTADIEPGNMSSLQTDNALLNEKGESTLAPFFWLRDEEDIEKLTQQTDVTDITGTPHDLPSFSDIKDLDDDNPSIATPEKSGKQGTCIGPEDAAFIDSEMFEWTQRPCSPELYTSPTKTQVGLAEDSYDAEAQEKNGYASPDDLTILKLGFDNRELMNEKEENANLATSYSPMQRTVTNSSIKTLKRDRGVEKKKTKRATGTSSKSGKPDNEVYIDGKIMGLIPDGAVGLKVVSHSKISRKEIMLKNNGITKKKDSLKKGCRSRTDIHKLKADENHMIPEASTSHLTEISLADVNHVSNGGMIIRKCQISCENKNKELRRVRSSKHSRAQDILVDSPQLPGKNCKVAAKETQRLEVSRSISGDKDSSSKEAKLVKPFQNGSNTAPSKKSRRVRSSKDSRAQDNLVDSPQLPGINGKVAAEETQQLEVSRSISRDKDSSSKEAKLVKPFQNRSDTAPSKESKRVRFSEDSMSQDNLADNPQLPGINGKVAAEETQRLEVSKSISRDKGSSSKKQKLVKSLQNRSDTAPSKELRRVRLSKDSRAQDNLVDNTQLPGINGKVAAEETQRLEVSKSISRDKDSSSKKQKLVKSLQNRSDTAPSKELRRVRLSKDSRAQDNLVDNPQLPGINGKVAAEETQRLEVSRSISRDKDSSSKETKLVKSFQNRSDTAPSEVVCAFCRSPEESEATGNMVHYLEGKPVVGDVAQGPNVLHSHRNCSEWAPNVFFQDDSAINLESELARSRRITCCLCGIKGAALGCYQTSCRKSFHVPCALMTPECRWDNDNFVMLCPLHVRCKLPCESPGSQSSQQRNPAPKRNLGIQKEVSKDDIKACSQWKSHTESKNLVLCCSGLLDTEKEVVSQFEKLSEVRILKNWDSSVTHVIASTNQDGACKRTLKVLMGILEGKWIITIEWVKACLTSMKLVNEQHYEIVVDTHGIKNGPSLGRLRVLRKKPKLFTGLELYFLGDFEASYKKFLQDLVLAGGGTVLHRKPISGYQGNISSRHYASTTYIIYNLVLPQKWKPSKISSTIDQRRLDAEALASSTGAIATSNTWILDSIAGCNLQILTT